MLIFKIFVFFKINILFSRYEVYKCFILNLRIRGERIQGQFGLLAVGWYLKTGTIGPARITGPRDVKNRSGKRKKKKKKKVP